MMRVFWNTKLRSSSIFHISKLSHCYIYFSIWLQKQRNEVCLASSTELYLHTRKKRSFTL